MTRESRMLLIVGLFGVGAVVALSLMAQRYGELGGRLRPTRPASSPDAAAPGPSRTPAGGDDPAERAALAGPAEAGAKEDPALAVATRAARARSDALAAVDAWLQVRRAVDDARATLGPPGADLPPESQAMLDGVRRRALAATSLEQEDFRKVGDLVRRWRSGEGNVGPAFEEAFSRRREALARQDLRPAP